MKTIKNLVSGLLTFALALPVLPAWASVQITPTIITSDGAVIDNFDGSVGASTHCTFSVSNTDSTIHNYNVGIECLDVTGKKIAGFSTHKRLFPNQIAPIEFYSQTAKTRSIKVYACIGRIDETLELYVSENGSDSADGSKATPVKTIAKAVALAGDDGAIINCDAGSYSIDDSISLKSDTTLNGVAGKTTFYSGTKIPASSFKKVTDSTTQQMFPLSVRSGIYAVDLSALGLSVDFGGYDSNTNPLYTSLSVDGEAATMARYPKEGNYTTTSTTWHNDKTAYDFSFSSDSVKAWNYTKNAWVAGRFAYDWNLAYGAVRKIDGNELYLKYYLGGAYTSVDGVGKSWYAYNLPEELTEEGEYVIYNNVLYYYPKSATFGDVILNTSTCDMISVTDAENVSINNITFDTTRGSFINVGDNTHDVLINNCTFKNSTLNGVTVDGTDNYNNTIDGCTFTCIGACPLSIGGGDRAELVASNNTVKNSTFTDVNQIVRTNCGAIKLSGCGVVVKGNTITKTPHVAIGYTGNNHLIDSNDISDCIYDRVGDAGIIYSGNDLSTLGVVISSNYIHDSFSGMGAVYYDDRLSGQICMGNTFKNVNTVIFIHAGVCNSFTNNTIENATYGVRVRGREAEDYWFTSSGKYFSSCLANFPWEGETWQNAYGNVLKYVNSKTDSTANETTIKNNTFTNVENDIWYGEDM